MASAGSILVTGTNGGLGSAIVQQIISRPDIASTYTGLYTVRNAATATTLQSTLVGAPATHKHETLDLDLGSLDAVRKFAADLNARVANGEVPKVRALILNAGYQEHTTLTMSDDGFEMTWQVNYLSNLLLSLLLLQSMDEGNGRVLIISSFTHDIEDKQNNTIGAYSDPRYPTLFPDLDDLAKGRWSTPLEDPSSKSGMRRYGASKSCAVMLLVALAERLAKDPKLNNISVIGLDPGGMPTNISRRGGFLQSVVVMGWLIPVLAGVAVYLSPNGILRTPQKSASDVIRACFEIDSPKGEALYLNGTAEGQLSKDARDDTKRSLLWEYGIEAAQVKQGETVLVDWK